MYYLGIDPGNSSGLALITGQSTVITFLAKDKKSYRESYEFLKDLNPATLAVGLEAVHAIWGASATATFGLGASWGHWAAILDFWELPYFDVSTANWQAAVMSKPNRPDTSEMLAYERRKASRQHKDSIKLASYKAATAAFPKAKLASHDVADAVNIARFLRELHLSGKLTQDNCKKEKVKKKVYRAKNRDEVETDSV